jgi:hypothetical protein
MIVEASTAATKVSRPPNLYNKALATFHCKEWIDPPTFISSSDETPEEAKAREDLETEYRAATNPTEWNMYLTLGRYAVDGYIFQAIMEDGDMDPLQAHCAIYYNYSYYSDRHMEIPSKLKAWTKKHSIPFLKKEKKTALTVDTKHDSWKQYAARLLLPLQWTEAVEKPHQDQEQSEVPIETNDDKNLNLIDFSISDWVAPPLFVPHKDEQSFERIARQQAEHVYKSRTTPTLWNRYLTLARYALIGPDFDSDMEVFDSDPLKVHCVVWYNYMYHIDRSMEVPPKLEAWATTLSEPYLQIENAPALSVDTVLTNWRIYAKKLSLQPNWSYVPASKKKPKKSPAKKQTLLKTYLSASSKHSTPRNKKPATIPEERSKEDSSSSTNPGLSTPGASSVNQPTARDDASEASGDSKRSALMPSLNVPVCDGTYRVTIRWKVPMEVKTISRQQKEMNQAIYEMLNKLFQDEDGFLYEWNNTGVDRYNVISKMTATEVSQFLCSQTYVPSQSLVIIPLRYAFAASTPGQWRNLERTTSAMSTLNITVSISNSTSTSGDLVHAGYILLKAPMNTHRLRYLQSLRKLLPSNAPPFDILLHKRSPTDELIPHLVVQCGEKHAHALSEALMNILTGVKSALYIPRTVFDDMNDSQAKNLFHTHDAYVKRVQWICFSPLLTNLDRPRVEHHSDGSITERTTREWAREIKSVDGLSSAWCDVVNGGIDQLAYLVFPPEHGEAAYKAFEEYRTLLYPFRQRVARYREKVGPAQSEKYNHKVIANLDFMRQIAEKLNTQQTQQSSPPSQTDQSQTDQFPHSSSTSKESATVSTPGPPLSEVDSPPPATHRDSDHQSTASDTTATTNTSRDSGTSMLSSDRMSTSSAKIREIEAVVSRQKQHLEKNEQLVTDRLAYIERHVHRMNEDIEKKLEGVQTQVAEQLTSFENRMLDTLQNQVEASGSAMSSMNDKLEKLLLAVAVVMNKDEVSQLSVSTRSPSPATASAEHQNTAERLSTSPTPGTRPPMESTEVPNVLTLSEGSKTPIQSPEKKRLRSAKKHLLKDSIRQHLDHPSSPSLSPMSDHHIDDLESIPDELMTPREGTPSPPLQPFSDLESQYTATTRKHKDHQSLRSSDPSLCRRKSK